jgi:hypothetical protein
MQVSFSENGYDFRPWCNSLKVPSCKVIKNDMLVLPHSVRRWVLAFRCRGCIVATRVSQPSFRSTTMLTIIFASSLKILCDSNYSTIYCHCYHVENMTNKPSFVQVRFWWFVTTWSMVLTIVVEHVFVRIIGPMDKTSIKANIPLLIIAKIQSIYFKALKVVR